MFAEPHSAMACPDPRERGPRLAAACDWLRLPPASLQGALVALIGRDTRGLPLDAVQRLSHFPASPMVSISWYHDIDAGLVTQDAGAPAWAPFGARVLVAGSQSHPRVTWAPTTGAGYMACFNADAAQALFDIDLGAIQDRFLPVQEVLGARFAALWQELLASPDSHMLSVLESHLAPRWQALNARPAGKPSLRQLGRNWVERLAWQAQTWGRVHSARHVERRIKSFSGRSLREWQSLVRTEGLFFAARDRLEAGQPLDWATLAQDEGFADQAHMSRVAKRITGFSPSDFSQRFMDDESFWIYRLWM
ncbi:AraC family transcriptional regulator [Massilia sp. PAMC28688]|uniref:helix-turn-helix domain-containing protein n=1 Tax=Massilia sp. PAMC28688 TaxID=2861283 RepID=UPI001C639156|nr:AraC family transcriptional regulator [Massilia sp. PAMC28688]QYF96051.1 AraC family transcriptional regulator [Massilia sp. PAMC28688]